MERRALPAPRPQAPKPLLYHPLTYHPPPTTDWPQVSQMQRQSLKQGDPVFRQGDTNADRFYIVEGGAMKVTSEAAGTLAVLGEGECFGETAILTGAPRNATVTCGTATCQVPRAIRTSSGRLLRRPQPLRRATRLLSHTSPLVGVTHVTHRRHTRSPGRLHHVTVM